MVRPISGGKASSALARSARWMWRRVAKRRYQRLHEDRLRDYEWALLNIKTLGYELARLLTNCQPRPVPTEAPTAALRAKLCTQSDVESAWVSFWCAEVGVGPVYHPKNLGAVLYCPGAPQCRHAHCGTIGNRVRLRPRAAAEPVCKVRV